MQPRMTRITPYTNAALRLAFTRELFKNMISNCKAFFASWNVQS